MKNQMYTYAFVIYAVISVTLAATEINNEHNGENYERSRRDLGDFETIEPAEKRQRQFIGKRLREFIGKRSSDAGNFGFDDDASTDNDAFESRLSDIFGDQFVDFTDDNMEKRSRQFVGKREYDLDALDSTDKRQRQFVGKRAFSPYTTVDDDVIFNPYVKRMRALVGKRYGDESFLVKRLREFVGKRFTPEDLLRMRRHRLFIQKPKYERELVGKRSGIVDNDLNEVKRLRQFVGKRSRQFIG